MTTPYRQADRPIGALVSLHRWRTGPGWLIGVFFLGAWVWMIRVGYTQATWETGDTIGLVVMSGVMLGLAWMMFHLSLRGRRSSVAIHEHALVHVLAGKTTTLFWDDVETLTSRIVRRGVSVVHHHGVVDREGRKAVVTQVYADVDVLLFEIQERLRPSLVRRWQEALAGGEAVDFGPFEIASGEIRRKDRPAEPLAAARARADIDDGSLSIRESGVRKPWGSFLVENVPNVFALEALLERLRG